jgi:hypothetical protein
MKTTLKTTLTVTLNALMRAGLYFQIRSLEITLDGQDKCLELVRCPVTLFKIEMARQNTRHELAKARGAYNATLPVGRRRVWRLA